MKRGEGEMKSKRIERGRMGEGERNETVGSSAGRNSGGVLL